MERKETARKGKVRVPGKGGRRRGFDQSTLPRAKRLKDPEMRGRMRATRRRRDQRRRRQRMRTAIFFSSAGLVVLVLMILTVSNMWQKRTALEVKSEVQKGKKEEVESGVAAEKPARVMEVARERERILGKGGVAAEDGEGEMAGRKIDAVEVSEEEKERVLRQVIPYYRRPKKGEPALPVEVEKLYIGDPNDLKEAE